MAADVRKVGPTVGRPKPCGIVYHWTRKKIFSGMNAKFFLYKKENRPAFNPARSQTVFCSPEDCQKRHNRLSIKHKTTSFNRNVCTETLTIGLRQRGSVPVRVVYNANSPSRKNITVSASAWAWAAVCCGSTDRSEPQRGCWPAPGPSR